MRLSLLYESRLTRITQGKNPFFIFIGELDDSIKESFFGWTPEIPNQEVQTELVRKMISSDKILIDAIRKVHFNEFPLYGGSEPVQVDSSDWSEKSDDIFYHRDVVTLPSPEESPFAYSQPRPALESVH